MPVPSYLFSKARTTGRNVAAQINSGSQAPVQRKVQLRWQVGGRASGGVVLLGQHKRSASPPAGNVSIFRAELKSDDILKYEQIKLSQGYPRES